MNVNIQITHYSRARKTSFVHRPFLECSTRQVKPHTYMPCTFLVRLVPFTFLDLHLTTRALDMQNTETPVRFNVWQFLHSKYIIQKNQLMFLLSYLLKFWSNRRRYCICGTRDIHSSLWMFHPSDYIPTLTWVYDTVNAWRAYCNEDIRRKHKFFTCNT